MTITKKLSVMALVLHVVGSIGAGLVAGGKHAVGAALIAFSVLNLLYSIRVDLAYFAERILLLRPDEDDEYEDSYDD